MPTGKGIPRIMTTSMLLAGLLVSFGLPAGPPSPPLVRAAGGTTSLPSDAPGVPRRSQRPLSTHTVCPDGPPTCDYSIIQDAVEAAGEGDTIKVAAGTYSDIHGRPTPPGYTYPPPNGMITQVVYLSKTVTVRGGYTTTNDFADPPDPVANPTTLDAQGQGRVLFVSGTITPTIEGLRITGGDAVGLGGGPWDAINAGGGVYVLSATATISNNDVFGNTAADGGGLMLVDSDSVLRGNAISANTATEDGGGSYLFASRAVLEGNTIAANTATGYGGGLFLHFEGNTLRGNTITDNTAGNGGGIFMVESSTISGNVLSGNTAAYCGGGLYVMGDLVEGGSTLNGNTITGNSSSSGGGLCLIFDDSTLSRNIIAGNSSSHGGGLHMYWSDPTLIGNVISANTASGDGGGLHLLYDNEPTLINTIIADNQAGGVGSGLYVEDSFPTLLHSTIAHNYGGDGSGIYATSQFIYSRVVLTNTILVSHTVGVYVDSTDPSNVAILEATLWGSGVWGNESDWAGDGTILTGTINIWDEPAFVDPDASDYHISSGSAAIDAGVDAGITDDIDGDPRPYGPGYDIGADELGSALRVTKQASTVAVRPEARLTYTLGVTNAGLITLNATISDVLPAQVTPSGTLTWTAQITPGSFWTETVVVTVNLGYVGPLTNVAQVSTTEGARGTYTRVVSVEEPIAGLAAINDSPTALGSPTTLTATVTAGAPVAYTWAFGDGTLGSGATPTHTYPATGVYTAVVTASNQVSLLTATTVVVVEEAITGLVAINDSPTALGSPTTLTATVTAGAPVAYTWDLGDEAAGSGTVVTHTYPAAGTYTALVTASNNVSLLTKTTTVTIIAACTPIVSATFVPTWTLLFSPTRFTPIITPGEVTPPISYTWNFGDGSPPLTDSHPIHAYDCGPNTVVLTASNPCSQRIVSQTVWLEAPTCCFPPEAGFTYTLPISVGQPITFTNVTTWCTFYPITYTWDFGDGSPPVAAVHPTHTYSTTGDFVVWLSASMYCGCDDWVSGVYSDTLTLAGPVQYFAYLPLVLRRHP